MNKTIKVVGACLLICLFASTLFANPGYYPTNITKVRDDDRIGICFFYHTPPLNTSWSLTGGDQFFYIDQREDSTDWTLYRVVSHPEADAAGVSIRARYTSYPTGMSWWDDFSVAPITSYGSNVIVNGDFETATPFFFNREGADETVLIWATDEASRYHRSYKIDKPTATATAVAWVSDNEAKAYWNNMSNVLYNFGAMVKTAGVNTNPATDDAKFGIKWEFYASGVLLTEAFAPVDQSVASKDWEKVESFVVVPQEPDSAVCKLMAGKDATGTVWFDELSLSSDPWTAGVFGWDAETPAGFMYWTAGPAEADIMYDDTEAHSGTHSVKIVETDAGSDEIVIYSVPYPVEAGATYLISCWTKFENINTDDTYYPSNVVKERDDQRLGICFFYHTAPLNTSWSLTGGDQFFYFDQTDTSSDGWVKYEVLSTSELDAAGVSMRARFTSFPTGTVWFDDFSIQKVEIGANVIVNGDQETATPFFFNREGADETVLIWATDEASRYHRSYKIDKPTATATAVAWVSDNEAKAYWNNMSNVLYNFGAMVKTAGVNTNPATDDAKFGIKWEFYAGGVLLTEAFAPVDQSVASKDWEKVESFVVVPQEPDSAVCKLMAGKDATGTVWFDELSLGSDPWTAGVFGWEAECPAGFMYWTAGPAEADIMYDDTEAHSGTYSAKIVDTDDNSDEIVWYSVPHPVDTAKTYVVSAWVKTAGVNVTPVPVTFQCNMKVQILKELFTPGTDTLCIRGGVAPLEWSGYANMLTDADGDSIYAVDIDFGSYTGDAEYKYVIKRPGVGDRWESIDNRVVTITGSPFTLDPVYFDNDSVYVPGVAGKVLFQVDMTVQHNCGFFDPDTHRLTVRGGTPPLDWAYNDALVMQEVLGQPDHYVITLDFNIPRGDTIEYKYQFSKQPDDGAYGGTWEERPEGGNYTFVYDPDAQGQQTIPERYFGEIGPGNVLAQDVDVTWQVDVSPVYDAINTVGYWYFEGMVGDTVWSVDSVYIAGAVPPLIWTWDFPPYPDTLKMYDDGTHGDLTANDSIFSRTMTFASCSPATIVHKYGINGEDNEMAWGVNHSLTVPSDNPTYLAPVATFGTQVIGVEEATEILPKTYMLGKGYPNPFARTTSINYQLPKDTHVDLTIYNVLGQKVATLVDEVQSAGYYTASWDGKSAKGTKVANGVYFYSLATKDYKSTEKLLLIR